MTPILVVGKHVALFSDALQEQAIKGFVASGNYQVPVDSFNTTIHTNSDLFVGISVNDCVQNTAQLFTAITSAIKDLEKATGETGFHLSAVFPSSPIK